MAKVTLKIRKEVEQEMEIDFPVYKRSAHSVYCIKSLNSHIKVENRLFSPGLSSYIIDIRHGYDDTTSWLLIETGTEITKEEFTQELFKALNHINYAAFMETAEPVADAIYKLNNNLQTSLNYL